MRKDFKVDQMSVYQSRKKTVPRDATERRITRLESLISEMDQNLSHITQVIGSIVKTSTEPVVIEMKGNIWFCESCGARLGIYDTDKEQLRIRYKEHIVYITPGHGGRVDTTCRRCSFVNTLKSE